MAKPPVRQHDPLWRVKTYIDRRTGSVDPNKVRRRQRAAERQTPAEAGAAVQQIVGTPNSPLEVGRVYRVRAGANPDTLMTAVYDGNGAMANTEILTTKHIVPILTGTAVWNPGNVGSGGTDSVDVTVTGAVDGDPCICGYTSLGAGQWLTICKVKGADTAHYVIRNETGSGVDLPSGTVTCKVFKA